MPTPYTPHRAYPGKTHRLRDAAAIGQMVIVRCGLCRRQVRYLAADLAELLGSDRDALQPPFPCSRCDTGSYMSVKLHLPAPGDYGHLIVRRPAGVKRIQKWKSVRLGD